MGDVYKKAREVFEHELDGIVGKGNIDSSELEVTYKIVDILKDLGEICKNDMEMNGMYDDEYSNRGYSGRSYRTGYSGYARSYSGEGNYSNDGGYGNYSNMRSNRVNYPNDYSGNHQGLVMKLRNMMENSDNDQERMMIQTWMDELRMRN